MTDYRPEGWVNPHVDSWAKERGHPDSPYEAVFEAGATALLEKLREGGVPCRVFDDFVIKTFRSLQERAYTPTYQLIRQHKLASGTRGTLIFIPDEATND